MQKSFWITPTRLRENSRKKMCEILRTYSPDGFDSIVSEIERDIGFYIDITNACDSSTDKNVEIRKQLNNYSIAFRLLADLCDSKSLREARAILVGEFPENGVLKEFSELENIFERCGERLAKAAANAKDSYSPQRGAPKNPDKAYRADLVKKIAEKTKEIGLKASREGDFLDLIEEVWSAIPIDEQPLTDIRNAGF